jgi:hypothetical protein
MKETRSIGIGRFAAIMALAAAFFMGDGTSLAAPPPIPPVVKIGVHEVEPEPWMSWFNQATQSS